MKLKSKSAIATVVNLICGKTFLMVPLYFKNLTESGSLVALVYVFFIAFLFLLIYLNTGKTKLPRFFAPVIAFFMVLVCAINLFEYSSTVSSLFFPSTPTIVVFLLFTVGATIGAYSDIGRINSFFVPVIYAVVFFLLVFTFSDGNYYYLFPVFGNGTESILSEGFFMLSSLFELVVLFYIPDLLENKSDIKKVAFTSLSFSFVIYLIIITTCLITVHTKLPENCFSPLFLILRQIKIGTYFQHPDTAFLIIYFISAFLYLSSMLFFVSHILSLSCRKLSKKAFYIPLSLLILTLGLNGEKLILTAPLLNKLLWIVPFVFPIFARRSLK